MAIMPILYILMLRQSRQIPWRLANMVQRLVRLLDKRMFGGVNFIPNGVQKRARKY